MTLLPHSTAAETRQRIVTLRETLDNERDRAALDIWLRHWWAEIAYDLDEAVNSLSEDVAYRWFGTNQIGDGGNGLDASSREFAHGMYKQMMDAGQMPGGPFDNERFAFADWGLMMDATFTTVFSGRNLHHGSAQSEPDGLYLVQFQMAVVHPLDFTRNEMRGEIMYASAPLHVQPATSADISRLLSRKQDSFV